MISARIGIRSFAAETKIASSNRDYEIEVANYAKDVNREKAEADLAYELQKNKSMRAVRAAASRVREDLRLRFLDPAFPPRAVDWESRPYHPGWVLHTWLNES